MKSETFANWRVEEINTGGSTEMGMVVVDRDADLRGISECCSTMCDPNLKRVHIIFDNRITPMLVALYLKVIKKSMPKGVEYIVKHADGLVIALIEYLWRRLQAYCWERGQK